MCVARTEEKIFRDGIILSEIWKIYCAIEVLKATIKASVENALEDFYESVGACIDEVQTES